MSAELHSFRQEDDVTRALPHAIQCEKSLLSSIIQDPADALPIAQELGLSAGHFYIPAHSILFGFLTELHDAGIEIELVTLVQRLLDRGLLDKIGGPSGLTEIFTFAPSFGHFRAHAKHVTDKFTLRSIIQASNEAIQSAYDAPEEVSELLDKCESNILAIRGSQGIVGEKSVKETIDSIIDTLGKQLLGEMSAPGYSTGYHMLDQLGATLRNGEVFVIAARPSVGKSAILMNIMEKLCIDDGLPGGVFSVEMSKEQMLKRMVFSRARISSQEIDQGYKPDMLEKRRIWASSKAIASSNLLIDATARIPISQLRAVARRWHKEHGIKVLGVDYLQICTSTSQHARGSKEREVADISAGLKALAKELNIPIIALAQLKREADDRTGKDSGKPRMSDIQWSGSIEQDSDMIGLLYRKAYHANTEEGKKAAEGIAEIILAKNRNGKTGFVPLTFIADQMRFESGSPYQEQTSTPAGRTYAED